jgi:superkiller protein 3
MRWLKKVGLILLILLPLGVAVVLPSGSQAFAYADAMRVAALADKAGNRRQEMTALQRAAEVQPWNSAIFSRLGGLYVETGEAEKAIENFKQAASLGTLSAEAQFQYANAWQSLGENEQAKELYRRLSESDLRDVSLLLQVAEAQKSLNDSIGTLATLLRARDVAPADIELNYQLGVQFAASQPENALPFLQVVAGVSQYQSAAKALIGVIEATTQIADSAERFIYIAQSLSTLGEWQAAGVAFDKARTLDPENGIAWALHGEAIQHVGESGFNDLSKALELAPRSDIVNGLMAVYYRRQQKYDLAIKYLYSASESNPNEPTWQVEIGNTLALQGQLNDALIHFQVATLMDESNPVPWRALASFCVSYNYLVDSVGVEAARKALLLNPGSGSALDLMGSVYLVMGDLDSSERFLLQAEEALPGRAEILYHLGQLYLQKGDKPTAFSYLRRAAEATTDTRIREAANRLIQSNGGE